MAKRSLLGGGVVLVIGVSAAVACGNYVPPDVGTYGPPNGLSGKVPLAPEGNDSGGGTTPPSGGDSGGGGGAQVLCQTSGGTLIVPDGGCSVHFSTDIFPKMEATGAWGCAGGGTCHGVSANATAPVMFQLTTASQYYTVLANYSLVGTTTVPYVNPCSTDPTQSGFACDVLATGAPGACGISMPTTPGVTMSATDQGTIATWVACGAPNN